MRGLSGTFHCLCTQGKSRAINTDAIGVPYAGEPFLCGPGDGQQRITASIFLDLLKAHLLFLRTAFCIVSNQFLTLMSNYLCQAPHLRQEVSIMCKRWMLLDDEAGVGVLSAGGTAGART